MAGQDTSNTAALVVSVCAPQSVSGEALDKESRLQSESELEFISRILLEAPDCSTVTAAPDGLFGIFASVDAAFYAACALLQAATESDAAKAPFRTRILLEDVSLAMTAPDDLRNIAFARMLVSVRQVPAGRIHATSLAMQGAGPSIFSQFRPMDADDLKDIENKTIYQAVCHAEARTRVATPQLKTSDMTGSKSLYLRWRDHKLTLTPNSECLTMGRSSSTDIHIETEFASRRHARLRFSGTDFLLADHSTNGTFVKIDDDEEVLLRSEQIVLRGSGVISLGRRIRRGHGNLIYFSLHF